MSLPADYHMHTPLCRHATGDPVELAAHAVEVGLTEIGFSDHNPMPADDFDDWRMRLADLDTYIAKVAEARQRFPQLTIKIALEVDYIPGQEDWVRDLAGRYSWDYFIGSVHYVADDWALDNPNMVSRWQSGNVAEIWMTYFERLTQAAASGLFEIIGHADLCKRFCFYPKSNCTRVYTRFLEAAAGQGVAIELNTAGLRKDCREIYPSPEFLRLAYQLGVPITFGSDAHKPEDVGANFADAIALARSVGYIRCCRFNGRKREDVAF